MATFKLSQGAEDDLVAVHQFGVRQWGVSQADAYFLGLFDQFKIIGADPLRFPPADLVSPNLRRSVYKAHTIYFALADGFVDIQAIVRSQNIRRLRN